MADPDAIGKHVVVLGMNHSSSSTGLRDRLLFTGGRLDAALSAIRERDKVLEALILSTCNRIEIYAVMEDLSSARDELLSFLSDFHGIPVHEFADHLYFYHCEEAVTHIFSVASSLDSMVIGETQILGQVKEAYQKARSAGATGTVLNKLIHFTVENGKRVRTETKIGDGVLSVSSAAVDLAKKILGDLSENTALLIGAGEMSELAARHLVMSGIRKLFFANRTIENATAMAERYGGTPVLLGERDGVMAECDIIISSTCSPHYIITPEEMKRTMAARRNRPQFLIDIAAPRDIHPDAGKVQNVFLYTIDDLAQVVTRNSAARAGEIEQVRAIIEQECENYFNWYRSLRVIPILVSLRRKFEKIRDDELDSYAPDLARHPEETRELVLRIATSLTKRFLSSPSKTLREIAPSREGSLHAKAIAKIFDLEAEDDGK